VTEKKTFKHPLGLTSAFSTHDWNNTPSGAQKYEIYTEGSGSQEFPLSEWEIEVIFTKKPPTLVPGKAYYYDNHYLGQDVVIVIAVHEDSVWYEDSDGDYYIGNITDFSVLD